jgi:hypothetical protein
MKWVSLAGLALSVFALTSCGGGSKATSDVPATTVVRTVVQTTVVEKTATAPAEPPVTTTPATTTTQNDSGSFTMPDEVGQILQDAQDDIQRVSGNPIFFSHSTDATGDGRHQILDADWKVCSQNIPAGTAVDQDSDISFAVVKTYEDCP